MILDPGVGNVKASSLHMNPCILKNRHFPLLAGELDESSKSLNILMELRKIANHPLLVLHRYSDDVLRQMSQDILNEPTYCDADPELVYEDMTVMTDFELHRLCLSHPALESHCLSQQVFGESGKLQFLTVKLRELKERVRSISPRDCLSLALCSCFSGRSCTSLQPVHNDVGRD